MATGLLDLRPADRLWRAIAGGLFFDRQVLALARLEARRRYELAADGVNDELLLVVDGERGVGTSLPPTA